MAAVQPKPVAPPLAAPLAVPVPPSAVSPLAGMVHRMRAGDAQAVAWFIEHYGPLIRRRVRSRLEPSTRRLFDSQEILSTLSRRLLRCVADGELRATTEGELWSLVQHITQNAIVDKVRVIRKLRSAEGPDSHFARLVLDRIARAERQSEPDATERELADLFDSLPSAEDKEILALWLNDVPHAEIADRLGISADAARQRWQSLKQRLREGLVPGVHS